MRFFVLALLAAAACSSSSAPVTPDSPDASSPPSPVEDAGGPMSSDRDSAAPDAAGEASTPSEDPKTDGPDAYTESDATVTGGISLHIVTPTGVAAPIPVVLIAPGYLIPTSEYLGYAKRLASHGIAGVTVGFTQSATNQKQDADDLAAALGGLPATFDATHAGVMGHSRGGKAAVLAAVQDARFVAVLGLDPVDTKPPLSCDPVTECPDASDLAATLKVPSGFLGETLDGTGILTACAPTADDYATFYASAPSPSFEVTIAGAGHMSFIDDPSACGLVCDVCKTPTIAQSAALDITYAYTAAFFMRYLRADVSQAAFLAGADATK